MKVVINTRFGGFELSKAALDRIEEISSCIDPDYWGSHRNDPILVQVIEELGPKSWGMGCKLEVVNLKGHLDYKIKNYDGKESVDLVIRWD